MKLSIKVYSFVGLPGSGKSATAYLAQDLKIPVIIMGDVIREEMQRQKIEISRESMGHFAKNIRLQEGMNIIAKKCMEKINQLNASVLFIDGLRNPEELEYFKSKILDFKVIYIEATADTRFRRLKARGRVDDPATLEDFTRRDKRELSFGIQEIIDQANYTINNEKDLKYLKEKLKEIIFL